MMSIDRAKQIINCYGGNATTWPEEERQAVQQLIQHSENLAELQQQALNLDRFMGFGEPLTENALTQQQNRQCAQTILENLPKQAHKHNPFMHSDSFKWIALVASIVFMLIGAFNYIPRIDTKETRHPLSLIESMALYVDDTFLEEPPENDEALEILAFLEPQIMDDDF